MDGMDDDSDEYAKQRPSEWHYAMIHLREKWAGWTDGSYSLDYYDF